jgi:hypothetical protein
MFLELVHRATADRVQRGCGNRGTGIRLLCAGRRLRDLDRQGGDGSPIGSSFVLDVAQGMGLWAVEEVQSARGPARNGVGVQSNTE